MKFQHISKYKMAIFLVAIYFNITSAAYSEFLSFKVGDQASYTISQKIDAECEYFDKVIHVKSEGTIDLDIKIVSSDEETLNYPFDVEVTLKKIQVSEVQQDGLSSVVINYDSTGKYDSNGLRTVRNDLLARQLDQLIDSPLYFTVDSEFQVFERTGYLALITRTFDSPSFMGLFGTTSWTFELLLTQLFQLAGEELQLDNSYPANCHQLLNWEDDKLDEQEINMQQSCSYVINTMDSKTIEASLQGNAKVSNGELGLDGNVSLAGNVTWDIANPMIQKRNLEVKIDETITIIPSHIKMSVQQTWQPRECSCD